MAASSTALRRYNIELSEDLYAELKALAEREQKPVAELVRSFIKLGLVALKVQQTPGAALIIREDGKDRELILI